MTLAEALADALTVLPDRAVAALSGRAGAGKSSLAASLEVPGLAVVSSDDFLVPALADVVSDDWGLDRARLSREVLEPFRAARPVRWRPQDWRRGLLPERSLGPARVLLVEGVGLLGSGLVWDLAVWLDVPAAVSQERGTARDAGLVDPSVWDVYARTDDAYAARWDPVRAADLVLPG